MPSQHFFRLPAQPHTPPWWEQQPDWAAASVVEQTGVVLLSTIPASAETASLIMISSPESAVRIR